MARAKSKRPSRPAHRRRGNFWSLIGLGALGLVLGLSLRRRKQGPTGKQGESHRPAPHQRPRATAPAPLGALPEGASTSWIPGPGGALRICEVFSPGALPVIFLHDIGGRLEHWSSQLSLLGPLRRGIAVDLPGHGESDRSGPGSYTVEAFADNVGAVADALRLRRFVLVGHGLGAAVAVDYAARHADRVVGLMLIDPAGDQTRIPEHQLAQLRQGLAEDSHAVLGWYYRQYLSGSSAAINERVLGDLAATASEALAGATEGSLSYNPLPSLERYVGPLASVVSDLNDLPHSLHNLLPELPVERLAGAGHWMMFDRPSELNELISSFLDLVPDQLRPATVH